MTNGSDFTPANDAVVAWAEERLIAAVRVDPPDEAALDELVRRHWNALFARCQMLTLNRDKACDLAQQVWWRLLRARHSLRLDGNLSAYLGTIATNLWRDQHRSARRAGPLSDDRLWSLDAGTQTDEGDTVVLVDLLPDLDSLDAMEQARLRIDIDEALARLAPRLREVLIARYLTGESCAEIALRHGRSEQAVNGWVRHGIAEMWLHFSTRESTVSSGVEVSASAY